LPPFPPSAATAAVVAACRHKANAIDDLFKPPQARKVAGQPERNINGA
jgi:hypothetical protein